MQACKLTWHLNVVLNQNDLPYFFQHMTTIAYLCFPWANKPWDSWLQILTAGFPLPFAVRWRLWRKREISLVCRQKTIWNNHSLSAHWYVLQRNALMAEHPPFQIGNTSKEMLSSVGCQLQGLLPAYCQFLPHSADGFIATYFISIYVVYGVSTCFSDQVFKKLKWTFWIERVRIFIGVRGNNLH